MEGADGKAGSIQVDYGFLCASSLVRGSSWDKVRHGNAPKVGAEGREREVGGRGGGEVGAERQVRKQESCCHKANMHWSTGSLGLKG